ncbi:Golgi SNAP receptor complex member 1-like [Clavelina lepadiformis]|uniref:Golgi SNAP receptor complex member 1 n=1 Tax=Clavelina lepadiformis TaxID=159417 RepID=A0ABP0F948_CLALP
MENQWEDLRRQARRLENELDLKLVSFSKLGTTFGRNAASVSDTTPLLNSTSSEHMVETMSMEIEQLLAKLTGMNDEMSEYLESTSNTSSAMMHTIQRHRDILQDYSHEFRKTKSNINACREREDLLGSVRRDIDAYKSSSGVNNRRTDLYMKEHEHLRNSDRLADEAIEIAMATKENLGQQRTVFKGITTRLTTLGNRFPAINNLVQKINLRKRRDSLIIATVIAVCIILILAYWLH